jgi:hypothetical protein
VDVFLIQYEVVFGEGKKALSLKDEMMVLAKNEKQAQILFLELRGDVAALIMERKNRPRLLVPVRELEGRVIVTSCKKYKDS